MSLSPVELRNLRNKMSSMMRGAAIGGSVGGVVGDLYGMATTPDDAGFLQEYVRPFAYAGLGAGAGALTGGAVGGGRAMLKVLPFVLPAAGLLGIGAYGAYEKAKEELGNEVHSPGQLVDWAFGTKSSSARGPLSGLSSMFVDGPDDPLPKTSSLRSIRDDLWRVGRMGSKPPRTEWKHLLVPKQYSNRGGILGALDDYVLNSQDAEDFMGTQKEGWRMGRVLAGLGALTGGAAGLAGASYLPHGDAESSSMESFGPGLLLGGMGAAIGGAAGLGTGFQGGKYVGGVRRSARLMGGYGEWAKDRAARLGRGTLYSALGLGGALALLHGAERLQEGGYLKSSEARRAKKNSGLIPAALLGGGIGAAGLMAANAAKHEQPSDGVAIGAGAGAAGMAGLWGLSKLPPAMFLPAAGLGLAAAINAGARKHKEEAPAAPLVMGGSEAEGMQREAVIQRMYGR